MARLCVRVAPSDASAGALRSQPGEVICIMEDGHEWSPGELACGQYRFIDVPGTPAEKLLDLMAPVEVDGEITKRRAQMLDATAVRGAPKDVTEAEIEAMKARR